MVFAGLLCVGWRNAGADAEGAEVTQKSQKVAKAIPNLFLKRLEPVQAVFMRVVEHKWLGRRMNAGYRRFGFVCWGWVALGGAWAGLA